MAKNYSWLNDLNNVKGGLNDLLSQAKQQSGTGDFYGLLGQVLSKQMTDGLPNMDAYRQFSEGSINKSFNNSRTSMKEDLASRGMGGSGAAMAAMAGLSGERASALGQNSLGLSEMDENYKQQALGNLMNLNAFGANAQQNQFQNIFKILLGQQSMATSERDFSYNMYTDTRNRKDEQSQAGGQAAGQTLATLLMALL